MVPHVLFAGSSLFSCYSCVNTPKLVVDSLSEKKTRTFNGCMIQIFGEHFFGGAEFISFLWWPWPLCGHLQVLPLWNHHELAAKNISLEVLILLAFCDGHDHSVAIYKCFHYETIMNWQLCGLLVRVSWVGAFLPGFIQILFIFRLHFGGSNVKDHFLCDMNPLLILACTDTHTLGLFIAVNSRFIFLINFFLLVGSYRVILHSLKTQSL